MRVASLAFLIYIIVVSMAAVPGAALIQDYYIGKAGEEPVFRTVYVEQFVGEWSSCPPGGGLYAFLKAGGQTVELPLANKTYYVADGAVYSIDGTVVATGLGTGDVILVQGGYAYRCAKSHSGYLVFYREFKAERLEWNFTVDIEPGTRIEIGQGGAARVIVTIRNNNEIAGDVRLNVLTNSGVFNYPNDCYQDTCMVRPWGANGLVVIVTANSTLARPGSTVQYVLTIKAANSTVPGSYKLGLEFYFVPEGVQLSGPGGFKIAGLSLSLEQSSGSRLVYLGLGALAGLALFFLARGGRGG